MNIMVLGFVVAVLSPLQPKVDTKTHVQVVCHAPETITVTVHKQKTYKSTYKLFDTQWEEIDTESHYEPIPDNMQITSDQLQEKYIRKCGPKKHI